MKSALTDTPLEDLVAQWLALNRSPATRNEIIQLRETKRMSQSSNAGFDTQAESGTVGEHCHHGGPMAVAGAQYT
jgi:hypothetical protein